MNWGSREECHCPSTVWEENIFLPRWYTKKYSIRCQISLSKIRYIVFQHKLLFNLDKDLIKWMESLGRSFTVRVQSERERIFDLGCIRKKYSIRCQLSRSKTRCMVFQHKLLFNLVKDLFKWIEGLWSSATCLSTVWERNNFWSRVYTKIVLDTLSNFALENSIYSVST